MKFPIRVVHILRQEVPCVAFDNERSRFFHGRGVIILMSKGGKVSVEHVVNYKKHIFTYSQNIVQ